MIRNMGTGDRLGRLVLAAVLLGLAFTAGPLVAGWAHWAALAVAAILVVTAIVGTCPAYLPFGLSTCARR